MTSFYLAWYIESMDGLLGRTNAQFPRTWLALMQSEVGHAEALVEASAAANTPLEITSQPALWGGFLRGHQVPVAVTVGRNLWQCDRAETATDMIMGELLQMLSCLGRDTLDIVFLRLERRLEEFQINGALEALELNRQDQMIRTLGFAAYGRGFASLAMWQFHDAFDICLLPRNPRNTETYEMLAPLAQERRVGVVTCGCLDWGEGPVPTSDDMATDLISTFRADHHVLVGVRSAHEVQVALRQSAPLPQDKLRGMLSAV